MNRNSKFSKSNISANRLKIVSLLCFIFFCSLCLWSPSLTLAADGDLDPDFGTGGKITEVFTGLAVVQSMAVQSDKKIVAVGGAATGSYHLGVARFLANGTLDPDFGVGGKFDFNTCAVACSGLGYAVAIQPADGKIVIAGTGFNTKVALIVVRLTSTGQLDPTFGTGGIVFPNSLHGTEKISLSLQGDNIVVSSSLGAFNKPNSYITRLTSLGVPDSSFGNGGTVTVDFLDTGVSVANASIASPTGNVVAVGRTDHSEGFDTALANYSSNGTLLKATVVNQGTNEAASNIYAIDSLTNVLVLPDQSIAALGTVYYQGPVNNGTGPVAHAGSGFYIARYSSGGDFQSRTIVESPSGIFANLLARDSDGRFYTTLFDSNSPKNFYLFRFNTSFNQDLTFGNQGAVPIPLLGNAVDSINALAVQDDGKVLAGGVSRLSTTSPDFFIARLLSSVQSSGTPMPTPTPGSPAESARSQIGDGQRLLKGLKLTVSKKDLPAQKILRSDLKKSVKALQTFINANVKNIPVSKKGVDLKNLAAAVAKAVGQALKLSTKTFTSDKKTATSSFSTLLKGIKK